MYIQYTYMQPLCSLYEHEPASKKHNDMQEFMTKLTGWIAMICPFFPFFLSVRKNM
jgi:hypothetical protein